MKLAYKYCTYRIPRLVPQPGSRIRVVLLKKRQKRTSLHYSPATILMLRPWTFNVVPRHHPYLVVLRYKCSSRFGISATVSANIATDAQFELIVECNAITSTHANMYSVLTYIFPLLAPTSVMLSQSESDIESSRQSVRSAVSSESRPNSS